MFCNSITFFDLNHWKLYRWKYIFANHGVEVIRQILLSEYPQSTNP